MCEFLLIFNYKEYKVPKVKYMKKDSQEKKIVYYLNKNFNYYKSNNI